ncbi:MAG: metal ABC transporter permease [Chloroflexota bacterium]
MLEPFAYPFFVRGLLAAALAGGVCGLLGVFIVLRRMAYIGHGLSHAVFGGAVVSYVLSVNFLLGASLWGFVSALLINQATRRRRIAADAAIGVVTTASFALGVALLSRYQGFTRSFDAALFGNILGVDGTDMAGIALVAAVSVLTVLAAYKLLLFATFEPQVARYYGVPTGWVDAVFSLVLAAAIVVCLRVLGVTMIAAVIVIPPVTARMLTRGFGRMMALSTVLGAACGGVGVYASYYADVSSGPAVVLTAAAMFVAAYVWTGRRVQRRTGGGSLPS